MGMLLPHLLVLVMLMTSDDVSGLAVCTAVAVIYDSTASVTNVVNVTCHFGQSISGHNFNVQFFPTPGSDPEISLVCNSQDDGLLCKKGKGVVFDENQQISDHFSLTKSFSERLTQGAQYQCQAVPQLQGPSHRCDVLIIHMPPTPTSPMHPGEQNGVSSLEVVIFLLLILFIIAVAVIIFVGYKRQDRIRKWCLGPIGDRWPGVLENPPNPKKPREESGSQTSLMETAEASVPEGLPQYFYHLGREAARASKKKEKEEDNPGSALSDDIRVEVTDPGEHGKSKSKNRKEEKSPGKEKEKESSGRCHVM